MGGGFRDSEQWSKDSYRDRSRDSGDRHKRTNSSHRSSSTSYSNVRRSSDYYHSLESQSGRDESYDSYHDSPSSSYSSNVDHHRQKSYYRNNVEYNNRNKDGNNYRESRDSCRSSHRTSRSRSRSCERDSSNNYRDYEHNSGSSGKYYDRYDDNSGREGRHHYQQQQQPYQPKEKKETPNNTLMIRNLPLHYTDKDVVLIVLSNEINKYGLFPKDVRLMKHKETGQSRGFAFIEFATVEQAIQLKDLTQGVIIIDEEHECTLHFSFPKDAAMIEKNSIKNDWACIKCGINNFKRRDECFKCGAGKDGTEKSEMTQHPTNVILLQNLSLHTTEERVLTIIGTLTSMPIKSIRITQDPITQLNVCTLEVHSVYEAVQLYSIITSMEDGFIIDDNQVSIAYGRRFDLQSSAASNFAVSNASKNAAMAALAAAQWKNLDEATTSKGKGKTKRPIMVTVNGIEYQKYDEPDYNSFQFDATSGYYYDSKTGFYYDSNSQYFYNSQTQKYMYYDTTNQIYVTVDSNGQATATATATTAAASVNEENSTKINGDIVGGIDVNVSKKDEVKIAKKIAKDMEKWAKTLNQKKENAKPTLSLPQTTGDMFQVDSSESIAVDIPKNRNDNNGGLVDNLSPTTSSGLGGVDVLMGNINNSSLTTSTERDPFEIIKAEEEKLTDWKRIACLLCKRQFNSIDQLTKHQQLSGLHKNNLTVLRQTLLNDEQLQHVENVERELGYRDRAKERRNKFGIDITPEYSMKSGDKDMPGSSTPAESPELPISTDNIGNKMLKAMGWTEGSGLGKSNQGISDIIQVERRRGSLGLGNNNATFTRETYKDAVRRTALQRFKEMSDNS